MRPRRRRTQAQLADLVLVNGHILTLDPESTVAEAIAVKNGRITFVGTTADAEHALGAGTVRIELQGYTVLPGFIDAHNHLAIAATDYAALDCSPDNVRSIPEMMRKLKAYAKGQPTNVWLRGVNYDDARLAEKRHPTRRDIDTIVGDRPVLLVHRGYHIAVINSAGMRTLGIEEDTPPPIGGEYGRDPDTGEFNGILYENAWFNLWGTENSPLTIDTEAFINGVRHMCEAYVSTGITSINDAWVRPSNFKAFQLALKRGLLPIRVNVHLIHTYLDHLEKLGLTGGFGNHRLKVVAVKLLLDGSVSGLTAALYDPYTDTADRGLLLMSQEEVTSLISRIHRLGFQVSVHANGDKAIDMVLDAFETALSETPREDHRHRIEHCSLLSPERIQRIKQLGLVPIIFAAYPYYHGDKLLPAFGGQRVRWLMACRALIDAGVTIAGHSDYPASPYNPLLAIHSLVNRRTEKGTPFSPEQAISVDEALRMYTINAAYASFDEHSKGSIEPGKLADFVVVRENPLTVAKDRLKDIEVVLTIVDGEIVFQNRDLDHATQ